MDKRQDDNSSCSAALEGGLLTIHRGTPENSQGAVRETEKPPGKGPDHFGIARSQRLAVFRKSNGGKCEIAWISPMND